MNNGTLYQDISCRALYKTVPQVALILLVHNNTEFVKLSSNKLISLQASLPYHYSSTVILFTEDKYIAQYYCSVVLRGNCVVMLVAVCLQQLSQKLRNTSEMQAAYYLHNHHILLEAYNDCIQLKAHYAVISGHGNNQQLLSLAHCS